ncbi:MAG: DNA primase [Burkholderiales bacterium]|nr:DNA primase [Burkholderiales bacterium]
MITQNFIQDLLSRIDIVDVIERDLPLKRMGANHQACCPFHNEKTPSFSVNQTKQFYYCFGCGTHGSAIGWVMEYSGLGFVEAVTELASSVGMTVPSVVDEDRVTDKHKELPELMLGAAQYYRHQLKQSAAAIAYLKQRGLTGEIAARYGLGYAPESWQNLTGVLRYSSAAALDTGLVIESDSGRRYDRFRDRIMFPIQNMRGAIIGFGGRVLPHDRAPGDSLEAAGEASQPKYMNSPETPLFEKGRELYGLFQARRAVRSAGRVLVVEGYMDVVALAQHGIEYAVATLGTATTPMHVQKLLQQSDNVVFCFDGDEAGRRAAWRALQNCLAQLVDGKEIDFLFLPQGEDPDSFVRKHGATEFEAGLASAMPLMSFLVRELGSEVNLQSEEGRAKLLRNAKPLVRQICAPMLGLMLRNRLAGLGGIGLAELDALYQIKSTVPRAPRRAPAKPPSVVRKLIELLLFESELVRFANSKEIDSAADLRLPDIASTELRVLRDLLVFLESKAQRPNVAAVAEYFRGEETGQWLADLGSSVFTWEEKKLSQLGLESEFQGLWAQFLERVREAGINQLHAKLPAEGWNDDDKARYRQLQQRPTQSGVAE